MFKSACLFAFSLLFLSAQSAEAASTTLTFKLEGYVRDAANKDIPGLSANVCVRVVFNDSGLVEDCSTKITTDNYGWISTIVVVKTWKQERYDDQTVTFSLKINDSNYGGKVEQSRFISSHNTGHDNRYRESRVIRWEIPKVKSVIEASKEAFDADLKVVLDATPGKTRSRAPAIGKTAI